MRRVEAPRFVDGALPPLDTPPEFVDGALPPRRQSPPPQLLASSKLWRAAPGLPDAAARCESMPRGGGHRCFFRSGGGRWRWIGADMAGTVRQLRIGDDDDGFEASVVSDAHVETASALRRLDGTFSEDLYRSSVAKARKSMEAAASQFLGFAMVAALANSNCSMEHRGVTVSLQSRRKRGKKGHLLVNATYHREATPVWGYFFKDDHDDVVSIEVPWDAGMEEDKGEACLTIRHALLAAWGRVADKETGSMAGFLATASRRESPLREILRSRSRRPPAGGGCAEAPSLLRALSGAHDATGVAQVAASVAKRCAGSAGGAAGILAAGPLAPASGGVGPPTGVWMPEANASDIGDGGAFEVAVAAG